MQNNTSHSMLNLQKYFFIFSLAALSFLVSLQASAHEGGEPVYLLVQVDVANWDKFKEYQQAAMPSLIENKAKVLIATESVNTLEGKWAGTWTVVIEFPSMEMAEGWYNSASYQKAIPYRHAADNFTNMIIAKQYKMPAPPAK